MKEKLIKLSSYLYWKIRLAIEKRDQYKYYLRIFNGLAKIKDIKTNLLTKEQKREIDTFYRKNYGKKVSYMWHNLIMNYTNKFDVRYIPPEVFLEIINNLITRDIKFSIFYDKNFFHNFVKRTGMYVPEKVFCSINGLFLDSADKFISKQDFYKQMSNVGEVFIKPTLPSDSGYSKNCRLINVSNGIDVYSKTNITDMLERYYTRDFVVQKKLVCHKSISDIYSISVNTFSVHSLILNNEVKILNNVVFKIGMNGSNTDFPDPKKEGLVIAIDKEGVLSDFALCIKQDKKYFSHPNTGVVFKNHKIENFHNAIETIKKLHSLIPWVKFCKWDITIDVDGKPVLLETEWPSELFQQQVLYEKGFFGEYTEEILSSLRRPKS